MNGHEHYLEAERLLKSCQSPGERHPDDAEEYPALEDGVNSIGNALAAAQVHATLALAAATAMPDVSRFMGDSVRVTDWGHAIGWKAAQPEADDENWSKTHCLKEREFGKCGRMKGHDGKCDTEEMPF